jgi:hypothetical protein
MTTYWPDPDFDRPGSGPRNNDEPAPATALPGLHRYPGPTAPSADPGVADHSPSAFFDAPADEAADEDPPSRPAGAGSPNRLLARVIVLQALGVAVLVAIDRPAEAVLVTAAMLPAVVAMSLVTFRSQTLGSWMAIWLSWRKRRRLAAAISAEGDPINPLWLLNRRLSIGTIRGFRHTELGVLQFDRTWVSAIWVTDGPQAAGPQPADGLTALLALAPSTAPGTTLYAVLQQSTTDLGAGPRAQMTAWLSVRADPLTAMPAAEALAAVPAMLRSEVRRLLRHTDHGVLKLMPLDRSDLLSALAASTEVPLAPSASAVESVSESWHLWHARGRFHHAFLLHPGSRCPLPALVALAMDIACYDPDAVLTVCIPYPTARRRNRLELPAIRLSHADPVQLTNLSEEIMDALDGEGAATRPLSGRHGPALLATSILAGRRHR